MTETGTNIVNFRASIADRIRTLSERWANNTMALGAEFRKARETFPKVGGGNHRPGWKQWIEGETGWSVGHANKFVRIADKFHDLPGGTHALSHKVLSYLATNEVPDEGVSEVVERAKKGERIGLAKAKDIIQPHRPSPQQARIEAREKGKLILASDGNLYSGSTEDEQAAYSQRRSQTYAVRDAIGIIAKVEVTPTQWLAQAEAHWIKDMTPAEIKRAIAWLTKLEGRYGHD